MASDSRKRTLEALERRIAVAKVEVLQKEKKTKNTISEDGKPSVTSPSSNHPTPKIGNFSFSGHATLQDIEDDAAYAPLSVTVNENLLTTNEKGRVLSSGSQTRALRIHSKRSKKHMSMKQHKKCGSLDLPEEFQKFDIFKPMHEMWKDYIMLLLKSTGKNQLTQCLLGADLHGAIILVVECKISHFTGICGIMIRETAESFGIITEDNKFLVVPKKVSVFVFQVDGWKVTLHGNKLGSRKVGL